MSARCGKILGYLALTIIWVGTAVGSAFDVARIDRRIEELQPKPEEKRFDQIGWADDIRHAKRLAANHNRPVFLFTHDGRMNIGRC